MEPYQCLQTHQAGCSCANEHASAIQEVPTFSAVSQWRLVATTILNYSRLKYYFCSCDNVLQLLLLLFQLHLLQDNFCALTRLLSLLQLIWSPFHNFCIYYTFFMESSSLSLSDWISQIDQNGFLSLPFYRRSKKQYLRVEALWNPESHGTNTNP